jgi:hypothetical protein
MEKHKKKDGFQFWNDDPTVWVKDNNIDTALKLLRKRQHNAKDRTLLNFRRRNTLAFQTRRYKRKRAEEKKKFVQQAFI